jgi:AraC-like DNA-binding protein
MGLVGFRQFLKPVQPTVRLRQEVGYTEVVPDTRLEPFIYCYWQLKSEFRLLAPFFYRVIPDGCVDIFFDVNDARDCRIMGFSTKPTEFMLPHSFHYAGIRFLPGTFPLLFDLDVSSLTDREEGLDIVVPMAAKQLRNLVEGQTNLAKIKVLLDQYFLKKVAAADSTLDKRLYNAIMIILREHGGLNLKSEIDIGISPRQLRRLFDFYVGASPKMFSKVIRFQYFFQLLPSLEGQGYNKAFLDAGYYDQPHFNKDFKKLFGLTPTEALRA